LVGGDVARRFYDWASGNNIANKIIFAADNNKQMRLQPSFPTAVVSPERLRQRESDMIIIASQHGYYEIAFQLGKMNFEPGQDFAALTAG